MDYKVEQNVIFLDIIREGKQQNIYSGIENEKELDSLPLGEKDKDFKYTMVVTVEDRYFLGTPTEFQLKVCLIDMWKNDF